MAKAVRRIVTGHNSEGKSIFIIDENSPNVATFQHSAITVTEMWKTASMPAENSGEGDAAAGEWRIQPASCGTVFRVIEYPPDAIRFANFDRIKHISETGGDLRAGEGEPRHPGMHKTSTVDYAIVLSGEIYAMMDEGEVLMKQGDCLVQRGTNHAWSNRSDKPCLIAFVLIDAKPAP